MSAPSTPVCLRCWHLADHREDGWCLRCRKGFSPYFLPLSSKMQFIAQHRAGLALLRQQQAAAASRAEQGWERTPGLSGWPGREQTGDLGLRSLLIQTLGSTDRKMTKGPIFGAAVFQPCTHSASAVRENANRPPRLPKPLQGGTGYSPSPAYVTPRIAFKWSPFCLLNKKDTALLIAY